ncbi:MAG: amidohydrolase family protein [Elusimicrobiota bacterium]
MLIDIHAHIFPDKIAKQAVEKLSQATGGEKYYSDGTLTGLQKLMQAHGVTLSVNQPVATAPEQVEAINRKMITTNHHHSNVTCFGAMHPDYPNPAAELEFIAKNGVRGIKLHPEYQDFYPDDDMRLYKIYDACVKYNLIILIHAGRDIAYADVHGTPERLKPITEIKGLKLILAHLGGWRMWDDVEKHLIGTSAYFDTAYVQEMDRVQMKRIILNHGADKILFGTDSPWETAEHMKSIFDGLGLSADQLENIYYKNAQALLGIKK